jgi:hypothetical protein
MIACYRCQGPVLPKTEDAFRRIAGRGEAYCPQCWDIMFPELIAARIEKENAAAKKSKKEKIIKKYQGEN